MAGIADYSTVPVDNGTVLAGGTINIAEGCAAGNLNNAIRQMMADLAAFLDYAAFQGDIAAGTGTFTGDVTAANLNIVAGNKARFGDLNFFAQVVGSKRRITFNSGQWLEVDISTGLLTIAYASLPIMTLDTSGNLRIKGLLSQGVTF